MKAPATVLRFQKLLHIPPLVAALGSSSTSRAPGSSPKFAMKLARSASTSVTKAPTYSRHALQHATKTPQWLPFERLFCLFAAASLTSLTRKLR